jgi:hypothetical protein
LGGDAREGARPLELAVPGALRYVAADHDRVGPQVRKHRFQRLNLTGIGDDPEVQIRDVQQLDGHDSICTV